MKGAALKRFLREFIDQRYGGSIRAAALDTGVAHTTLWGWVEGRSVPSQDSIGKIATWTGKSTDEVLYMAGYSSRYSSEPPKPHLLQTDAAHLPPEIAEHVDRLLELSQEERAAIMKLFIAVEEAASRLARRPLFRPDALPPGDKQKDA